MEYGTLIPAAIAPPEAKLIGAHGIPHRTAYMKFPGLDIRARVKEYTLDSC